MAITKDSNLKLNDPVVLGFSQMDDIHHEFELLLQQAQNSLDEELPAHITAVREHLQMHFETEDKWMIETDFPAKDCHILEHADVLRSAQEVANLMRDGNMAVGRSFLSALEAWFPAHADYLDSALAHWMFSRQVKKAKPIVFHKNPNRHNAV